MSKKHWSNEIEKWEKRYSGTDDYYTLSDIFNLILDNFPGEAVSLSVTVGKL